MSKYIWLLIVIIPILMFVLDKAIFKETEIFCMKLEKVSKEKFKIAQSLSSHPLYTKGKVEFLVNFGPTGWLFCEALSNRKKILISPVFLLNRYFEVLVAHELGHIQYGHKYGGLRELKNEIEADYFATLIFGKEKVLKMMLGLGSSEDNPRVFALKRMK